MRCTIRTCRKNKTSPQINMRCVYYMPLWSIILFWEYLSQYVSGNTCIRSKVYGFYKSFILRICGCIRKRVEIYRVRCSVTRTIRWVNLTRTLVTLRKNPYVSTTTYVMLLVLKVTACTSITVTVFFECNTIYTHIRT